MATRRNIQIHSMTGFANAAGECGGKRINLEIRAVNHRYLDVQFRMPEELRYLEGALREQIAAAVARGKLECRIQLQDASSGGQTLEVNQDLVAQLAHLNKTWRKEHDFAKLSVADVLRFPGVLAGQGEDAEALAKGVKDLLTSALKEFAAARKREGKKLGEHLLQRLDGMEEIVDALNELFPSLLQRIWTKSKPVWQKPSAISTTTVCNRNLLYSSKKSDVDEEFSRFAHPYRRSAPHRYRRQGQCRQTFGFSDAGAQPRSQHFGQQGHRRRMHASVG